ncbi:MAG: GyrI-like domain-containing protein [Pseudomonadota bacterium]
MARIGEPQDVVLPALSLVGVRRDVPFADMPNGAVGALFSELSAALSAAGYRFWAPEIALYRAGEDVMHCFVGAELSGVIDGLTRLEVPATPGVSARHIMSIPEFGDAHIALHEMILARGQTMGSWAREVYRGLKNDTEEFEVDIQLEIAGEAPHQEG